MVYNWIDSIQTLLYPPRCQLCGGKVSGDPDLCAPCRRELPHNAHPCPRCALPMPAAAPAGQPCGHCRKHPPPFQRCIAPFLYAPPLDHLITGLKFQGRLTAGRLLSALLADHLEQAATDDWPEALVPIPLHPTRLRSRGYNQALELARPLGRRFGIPLLPRLCRRTRATAPQREQHLEQRHRNLRGAFRVSSAPVFRHLAIVDDVVTTGATAAELARVLLRAGARRVDVWSVARTPRDPARSPVRW